MSRATKVVAGLGAVALGSWQLAGYDWASAPMWEAATLGTSLGVAAVVALVACCDWVIS